MKHINRPRARTLAASISGAAGTVLLASLVVPALAHDEGAERESSSEGASPGTGTPSSTPEETLKPIPEVPGPPILSRADLERYEAELDPDGSPLSYVCANVGDTEFVVVQVRPAPKGLEPDPDAGPVEKLDDPCAGKSLIVGN